VLAGYGRQRTFTTVWPGVIAAKKAAGYYTPEPPKAEDLKTSGRPLEKY